ncbi:nucleotidyltransferase family protein [Sphingomonas sp. MMSM20]|uniref:nucleotidyltransferase family protein n=1 Tax=Sphingomonas lycopersici TaxID=2951807 RepID=UPI0022387BCB|nr:nucleotidyltransferase family protein [Sphingomonas lycopersici]MCW6532154.1 nucleotidyltransferase family protein [Sphingomonas lycopersici]
MIAAERVGALLLAAGESRRFGAADKLLAELRGQPLVRHVAERLAGLGFGARIAVCSDDRVAALLDDSGFHVLRNDAPGRGLSHSLALGIGALPETVDAALICLGDMPNVAATHVGALLARFDPAHAPIVASDRAGQPMPPALFGRSSFADLRARTGDRGARDLLATAARVPAAAGWLADIDTPADLARAVTLDDAD